MKFVEIYKTLDSMMKPKSLVDYAVHVIEWNRVAAVAKGGKFTPLELQHDFIIEEFEELAAALEDGDRKMVVDAACDLFVVASYAYILDYGRDSSFDAVMSYNSKNSFNLFDLSYSVYVTKSHREILSQVVSLCYSLDMNLQYNMSQVLSSNDSKFPRLKEVTDLWPQDVTAVEALEMESKAIEARSNGRYTGVYFVTVKEDNAHTDGPRVVFFDEKGKIMKPCTFVEPEIIV